MEIITITRTNGKGNFLSYIKMLDCFEIKYLILGDLDCFEEEVDRITDYLRLDAINDDLKLIKSALKENANGLFRH